jgi:hypothetical protein
MRHSLRSQWSLLPQEDPCNTTLISIGNGLEIAAQQANKYSGPLMLAGIAVTTLAFASGDIDSIAAGTGMLAAGGGLGLLGSVSQAVGGVAQGAGGADYSNLKYGSISVVSGLFLSRVITGAAPTAGASATQHRSFESLKRGAVFAGGIFDSIGLLAQDMAPQVKTCPRKH